MVNTLEDKYIGLALAISSSLGGCLSSFSVFGGNKVNFVFVRPIEQPSAPPLSSQKRHVHLSHKPPSQTGSHADPGSIYTRTGSHRRGGPTFGFLLRALLLSTKSDMVGGDDHKWVVSSWWPRRSHQDGSLKSLFLISSLAGPISSGGGGRWVRFTISNVRPYN